MFGPLCNAAQPMYTSIHGDGSVTFTRQAPLCIIYFAKRRLSSRYSLIALPLVGFAGCGDLYDATSAEVWICLHRRYFHRRGWLLRREIQPRSSNTSCSFTRTTNFSCPWWRDISGARWGAETRQSSFARLHIGRPLNNNFRNGSTW